MHQKSLLGVSLIAALGVFAGPLQAFSLGEIKVHSALNQPFEADITLHAVRSDERDNLQVRLASEAEFERAGLARPFALTNLQFDVVEKAGKPVVRVSSESAIKEPFLDFIISATAGEGRMLREYTVLLDPPRQQERAAANYNNRDQTAAEPQPAREVLPDSYQVRSNDTLWQVAERVRPNNNVSVYQMMMALFERNPQAFADNNINNLRAGAELDIPDAGAINSLSASDARQAFNRQTEQWQQNRSTAETAAQPDASEQPRTELPVENVTEAPAGNAETESAPSAETRMENGGTGEADNAVVADARLDLVAPNEELENAGDEISNQGDPELQQISEQLTFAQETIEAQNQENIDLKARMDKMEAQIDTMRRLLSLKDADLARLQSLLADNEEGVDDLAAALQAQQDAQIADNTDKQPPQQNTDAPDSNAAANQNVVNEQTDAASPAGDNAQPTANTAQPSLLRDYAMPVALGLLLILLLALLMVRRRQSLQAADVLYGENTDISDHVEAGDDNSAMIPPEVTELDEAPAVEETKSTAELIEQADMFVGYADYTQALNTLQQAQLQAPDDQQVIYKRLFVLYKLQRTNDFVEQLADVEFAGDSEEWQQIVSWGRELDPAHPLFRESSPALPSEAEPDNTRQPETTSSTDTVSAEYVEAFDTLPGEASATEEPDLDFILDKPPATENKADDSGRDRPAHSPSDDSDLNDNNTETRDPTADIEPVSLDISDIEEPGGDAENNALSLDSFEDEPRDLSSGAWDVTPPSDSHDDDLTLDLSDYDDIDECETKLELASAYMEMEDQQAAREILNEVVSEGNDSQQERARALLNSLD